MSDQLQKIMNDGYNPHKQLLDQTRKLVHKWEPTGLLEGLDGENDIHGMSVLLENQARQLIDENSTTSPAGTAATNTNQEEWSGVALPLVRRIFGEIASKDFVSVQPMNLPSGLVFFLQFKYGSGTAGPKNPADQTDGKSVYGTTGTKDVDASGGFYGEGRYGYSSNTKESDAFGAYGIVAAGTAQPADVNFDVTSSTVYKYTVALPSDADVNAVRTFTISGTDSAWGSEGSTLQEYTSYHGGTTYTASMYSTVNNGANAPTNSKLYYSVAPTDINRGDFESRDFTETGYDTDGTTALEEANIGIPEIDVEMTSEPIVAKTRKLKAVWTPELAQDLNAYHSVDAEAELTSMLSEYISMEIDLEILDMLIANASTTEYWDARIGYEWDSTANNFSKTNAATEAYAYTKNEWFQTLGNKIQRVSNKIHQKTLRGGANFLVCGPDVATVIESMPGWNTDTDGNQSQFAMGVQQVGTLRNRWNVYKNPYMKENTILTGFRGSQFLETGAVYAPYIPLIMTPLVYDPVNFTPRKGVMTRYAKKIVRPEFYGKIIVSHPEMI